MTDQASLSRAALRDAILQTNDIEIVPVPTPEWPRVDGQVYVRTLEGTEKEAYLDSIRKTIGTGRKATIEVVLKGSGAKLAALAACNKGGERIFTDADVAALGKKSAKALKRVVDAAAELNGLSDDDDVAEAVKNASAETSDGEPSTA